MNYEHRQLYTSRDTTPRQRRLKAERQLIRAQYHSLIADILGALALAILIIALFYLA